jgi:hypothetical protein
MIDYQTEIPILVNEKVDGIPYMEVVTIMYIHKNKEKEWQFKNILN